MGTFPSVNQGQESSLRTLSPCQTMIRSLSQRLVDAQRPIRILDAVRWDHRIEEEFFAAHAKELPRVTRETYGVRPLSFSLDQKRQEFAAIESDTRRCLGKTSRIGRILTRMSEEYRQVLDMLETRGTSTFSRISRLLYGSSHDSIQVNGPSLAHLTHDVDAMIGRLSNHQSRADHPIKLTAVQAAAELSDRLGRFFGKPSNVRVQVSGDILADAAAGCDYLKIREDAFFSAQEIRLLEVHEGWVHLGTTLNGQSQPICTFLSKGPPSSTITQEGLAVLTEVLSNACYPQRVRRLLHRVEGIHLVEEGANFLEVYQFYLEMGYEPRDSYHQTVRIFRGSVAEGAGPFTKDLSYIRGFALVVEFLKTQFRLRQYQPINLLFCGKTTIEDMETLVHLSTEGLVTPPRFLPPPFENLDELSSRFLHLYSSTYPDLHQSTWGNLVGLL